MVASVFCGILMLFLETVMTKRQAYRILCYAEDPMGWCALGQSEFCTEQGLGHGMLMNSELKTFFLTWLG